MKKLLFIFAGFALLFTACNMAIPESVSVKTDADYNFSIGDIKKELKDDFKVSKLFDNLADVYDYFPGKKDENLRQFILTVDVASIDLQLDGYDFSLLKGLTLADALSQLNITIPLSFDNEANPTEIEMKVSTIFDSFKVLGEEFKDKVNFADLAVYMYCDVPSGVETDASPLNGSIKIENADNNQWLIGKSKTEKYAMKFASFPNLAKEQIDDEEVVVTDISAKPSSINDSTNMTSFINNNKTNTSEKQNLTYYIDIDADKLTCTGDPITKLDIKMCLVLPLKFAIASSDGLPLKIDLKSLSKGIADKSESELSDKDKDIFSRDKATDISDIEKYLDAIEKVVISYKTRKNPFIVENSVIADPSRYVIKSTVPYISETASITQDSVDVTGEQLKGMLEKYPYEPTVALEIENMSSVTLPRDITIDLNMALMISTNGNTIKF
ncbi:hypothetical protein MSI_18300 [Treponema sp. JC4]|uniref:hypothetical protein n=1 Tax=Treponema sp. JC4 TaxID=1124982 RepID=UPI00025B076F|nr:hypothetical protein [Treponema sp. JC4]EID84688.1 hypothetical protein MSI_18300 [Treponema sp. JC4]